MVADTEDDGEDDAMTKLLLGTIKEIFSACRDKPSLATRRQGATAAPGPELVMGYEETDERAAKPLATFWSGLRGRCVYNEVSQPELHPGFRCVRAQRLLRRSAPMRLCRLMLGSATRLCWSCRRALRVLWLPPKVLGACMCVCDYRKDNSHIVRVTPRPPPKIR